MRQRLSLPFGKPSPVYGEQEAVGELVKMIRENVTHKYETGWAVRARDCSGRTRVEMLDGAGGGALGLANACDDGVVVGSGGVAEIWWAQRSQGRTVRLSYDLGTRAGRTTVSRVSFPVEREMPVAPVVTLSKVVLAAGNGTYQLARSEDGGETWAGVTSANLPTRIANWGYSLCYGAPAGSGIWLMGGSGTNHISYSTDGGATWTGCGQVMGAGGTDRVRDIAWNGSYFVAVGDTQVVGYVGIAVSANGVNWTQVAEAACIGIVSGDTLWRVTASGTRFVVSMNGPSGSLAVASSADNGANWKRYVMRAAEVSATVTPPEFDVYGTFSYDTIFQATGANNNIPVAGDGSLVVGMGYHDQPSGHSAVWRGDSWSDTQPLDPLAVAGMHYLAANTSRVGEALNVLGDTPGQIITDIIWDGTQFIGIAVFWYTSDVTYGTTTAWVATSTDGETWTEYLTSEGASPGGLELLRRIRVADGRYVLAGTTPTGDIGVAYSDDPTTGWTLGTATEALIAAVDAVAVEED